MWKKLIITLSLILACSSLQAEKKFVVYTPPKCGTFLIGKAMELMTHKAGHYALSGFGSPIGLIGLLKNLSNSNQFLVTHTFNQGLLDMMVRAGYKIIFIMRDPRDQLLSMSDWMAEGQWSHLDASKISNESERITELITGSRYNWKCCENCIICRLNSLKSLDPSHYFIVRYEDLVGPQGGGTQGAQLQAIFDLAAFLDLPMTVEEATNVANNVFGKKGVGTFRNGIIGRWREHFSPEQKELFNSLYARLLTRWGYSLE